MRKRVIIRRYPSDFANTTTSSAYVTSLISFWRWNLIPMSVLSTLLPATSNVILNKIRDKTRYSPLCQFCLNYKLFLQMTVKLSSGTQKFRYLFLSTLYALTKFFILLIHSKPNIKLSAFSVCFFFFCNVMGFIFRAVRYSIILLILCYNHVCTYTNNKSLLKIQLKLFCLIKF
jgi:hypothetical protein